MSKIDHSLFDANAQALDGNFGLCPDCSSKLQVRRSKSGAFLGCSAYPKCGFSKPLHDNQTQLLKEIEGSVCPECSNLLAIKKGRYGLFIGCTHYPECDYIEAVKQQDNTHVSCPSCKTGRLIKRSNKFGKSFYACDQFPKCKYALNYPPKPKSCPKCNWPVMVERSFDSGKALQCPQKSCGTRIDLDE